MHERQGMSVMTVARASGAIRSFEGAGGPRPAKSKTVRAQKAKREKQIHSGFRSRPYSKGSIDLGRCTGERSAFPSRKRMARAMPISRGETAVDLRRSSRGAVLSLQLMRRGRRRDRLRHEAQAVWLQRGGSD